MSTPFSGGCACGAIRYECTADPVFSWNCHCRDCQRASGSAFCPVSYVPKIALTALSSTRAVAYYEVQAESGNTVRRGFCPQCGAPVFILAELVPDLIGVWAASRDEPGQFQPAVNVWTASGHPWDVMHAALPACPKAPTETEMQKILGSQ